MRLWHAYLFLAGLVVGLGINTASAQITQEPQNGWIPMRAMTPAPAVPETPLLPVEQMALIPFIKPPCGVGTYVGGQCTYGVASWTCVPSQMGNANRWDDYARANGYVVDNSPVMGAIAQSDAGYYGHVALVLRVENGQVLTRGMNEAGPWSVRERWSPISAFKYIHF